MNRLKTIEEHNIQIIEKQNNWSNTGVQCPHCGDEMHYKDHNVLMTNPPMRAVHCKTCKYSTTLFV